MSEKKNIERLFQEKFKDFEAIPSQKVWDNIEEALREKKKRRVVPIWFRLSGVAALLIVGALIGYGIWNDSPENNDTNRIVNQEEINSKNEHGKDLIPTNNPVKNNEVVTDAENSKNAQTDFSTKNNSNNAVANQETSEKDNSTANIANSEKRINSIKNKNAVANSQNKKVAKTKNTIFNQENTAIVNSEEKSNRNLKNKSSISNSIKSKNEALAYQENLGSKENNGKTNNSETRNAIKSNTSISENKIASEKEISTNKTQIAFNIKALEEQKKDSTAVATVVPNPLEELLLQQEKEKQAVTETKVNRWQITSNVAPIYFSSASNGSPISQEFSDNSKSYERNMSYGVGVNYALSDKWAVRGGVNKLTLGYNTNNIIYYAGLSDASARGANTYQAKGSSIIIEDNTAANVVSFDNVPGKNVGYLNQTMGYIEVPVELSYALLNKKFGIELIGGMSTMFLNENSLSVVSGEFVTSAGKADNLNDVSFTSNIGLGFKYNFWKNFQANIEPRLKYQLNTFSENDGGFKPYFIGIYSGLSFKF